MGSNQISPEALVGFVVGEGCFYVESGCDKKYRLGWRIRPAFCVEVREDDRPILEALRETLRCGNIYELDFGRYRGYAEKGWRPHVKYRVSNFEEILSKVVPFFERYPLFGRKKRCFKLFQRVVVAMRGRQHLDPQGLEQIKEVVRELNHLNKKGI